MALQAEYKLSGGVWTDTSGNGYNLTASGTVTQAAGFQGGANTAVSMAGGTGNGLTVADPANLSGLSAFSFICRFKATDFAANQYLVSKAGNPGQYEYDVYVSTAGNIKFRHCTDGSTLYTLSAASNLTAGTWYVICCVWDGANKFIYINDMVTASASGACVGAWFNGTDALGIGCGSTLTLALRGTLDDVRVYNSALSQADRQAYTALGENFAGPASASISYTQDSNTVAIAAAVPLSSASLNYTQGGDIVAITAASKTATSFAYTQGADSVSIAAALLIPTAHISYTQGNDAVAMAASIKNVFAISYGQADNIVSATASVPVRASFSYTQASDVTAILAASTALTEKISWYAGQGDTGAIPTFRIRRMSDGYYFDFSSNTFKPSGWITVAATMVEIEPRLYEYTVTTSGFDGYYQILPDSLTTLSKPLAQEVRYSSGVRLSGGLSFNESVMLSRLDVNVSSRSSASAADNAAAVLAAAITTPIAANVKKISDVAIIGNGSTTPFGV